MVRWFDGLGQFSGKGYRLLTMSENETMGTPAR
jgi:hypothetical protein